jgi:protoheme IX farnesyltransferase
VVLFAVIFMWTPPHFWALAIKYRDDYAAADVPMLPVVASLRTTNRQIVLYTVVVWALTMLFGPVGHMGALYYVTAGVAGALFLWLAVTLLRRPSTARAMQVFGFSITYLVVLFGALAVDQLVRSGL